MQIKHEDCPSPPVNIYTSLNILSMLKDHRAMFQMHFYSVLILQLNYDLVVVIVVQFATSEQQTVTFNDLHKNHQLCQA